MVKRVSILFNTLLRAEMNRNPELGKSKGMAEIMRLVHTVLTLVAGKYMNVNDPYLIVRASDRETVPLKFFSGGYAESDMLREVLDIAGRLDIVISRWLEGRLMVEFIFFPKGKRDPLGDISVVFEESDGLCDGDAGGFLSPLPGDKD